MEDKARQSLGSYAIEMLAKFLKKAIQKVVLIEGYSRFAVEDTLQYCLV